MESFLLQAALYLGIGLLAVPLAMRFGLGSILGYLIAGICIGPIFGFVGDTSELQHFAEFGVVMLLFIIGLELEPQALWKMRGRLLTLGGFQVALSTALIGLGAYAIGLAWQTSLAIGLIFALSSTAIVLQTLNEKDLIQSSGGRSAFSVLLMQDIAVIPMLALLPLLAVAAEPSLRPDGSITRPGDAASLEEAAHHSLSMVEGLPGWAIALITAMAIAAIVLAGMFLTRPLFRYINAARLRELNTALSLFIVVSIAVLMNLVGLSPALGAFLAGVLLAGSEFRHELESDIEPFKGMLLGLFFITVGAGINFNILFGEPLTILGLTVALILIKGAVLFVISLFFTMSGKDRMLFTLSLAQAGEFGFVLISLALQQSVFSVALGQYLLLIVAMSMLLTPLMFIVYEKLAKQMADSSEDKIDETIDESGPIIIAGIGRFGQVINQMVSSAGFKTTVLDHDVKTIELLRKFGFKGYLGNLRRPEVLQAAGLAKAKVFVVALDDKELTTRVVKYAKRIHPGIHVVARAVDRMHVYELHQAGADDIVRELFDSSLRAGRYVLENLGWTEYDAAKLEQAFFRHDRRALRDLADLWDPQVPVHANTAFVERAKDLNKDLETQILQEMQDRGISPRAEPDTPVSKDDDLDPERAWEEKT